MNSKSSQFKWLRSLGNLGYFLGVAFLIASVAVNSFPAHIALAQGNGGAIWTTTGSCGAPQDSNSFAAGDHVFIHGSGFEAGDYTWFIKGKPGGASGDPGDKVAQGNLTVDASGAFCFDAYKVHADDWGEYAVKVGNKGDNYHVDGSAPSTIAPTSTPTDVPVGTTVTPTETPIEPNATPTDTPTSVPPFAPIQPTATPTDTPTDTSTPGPDQPTATPTDTPTDTSTPAPDQPTATPTSTSIDTSTSQPSSTPTDIATGTPTDQPTVTNNELSLSVSAVCGPNAKHVNWWKINNPHAYVVPVVWEIMPSGAPADYVSLPANADYEFSTVKVTGQDTLVVYLDPQGNQQAGSAAAAQGCGNDPQGKNQTSNPGTPGPAATLAPSAAVSETILNPVTGADLGSGPGGHSLFFSLGIGFLGLGLVLNGIARERKSWDV